MIAVPWIAYFGYESYQADKIYKYTVSLNEEHSRALPADWNVEKPFPPGWQAKADKLSEEFEADYARRKFLFRALFSFPVGAPIVFFIGWWVIRGFRKRPTTN